MLRPHQSSDSCSRARQSESQSFQATPLFTRDKPDARIPYHEEERRHEFPAHSPVNTGRETDHVLDVGAESVGTVDPADRDRFRQDGEQHRVSGRVSVQQVEEIKSALYRSSDFVTTRIRFSIARASTDESVRKIVRSSRSKLRFDYFYADRDIYLRAGGESDQEVQSEQARHEDLAIIADYRELVA